MSARRTICAALVVVALVVSSSFASAQFRLPDPPPYAPARPPADPLVQLRDAKVSWLKKKIKAEESWIRTLERKKDVEDINKEVVDKDIQNHRDAIKQDQSDIDALSEKDALKPDKNSDAGKHAKLIEKNVKAWLAELEAAKTKAAAEAKGALAKVNALRDQADALQKDLDKAKKAVPKLFE